MNAFNWIHPQFDSLLDIGCNVGALLSHCAQINPKAKLAGVEINGAALEVARSNVPSAALIHGGAESLPFQSNYFQYITCIEVLEHIPEHLREDAFREMHRVLMPGGRLILTVPHAG